MIFITWLSLCGTENRHITKDLTGLFKTYILLGQTKRAVDYILLKFFVELDCTST